MKVTITDKEGFRKDFPKLMISVHEDILFMTNPQTGIVLKQGHLENKFGEYSEEWNPLILKDYENRITLENDK